MRGAAANQEFILVTDSPHWDISYGTDCSQPASQPCHQPPTTTHVIQSYADWRIEFIAFSSSSNVKHLPAPIAMQNLNWTRQSTPGQWKGDKCFEIETIWRHTNRCVELLLIFSPYYNSLIDQCHSDRFAHHLERASQPAGRFNNRPHLFFHPAAPVCCSYAKWTHIIGSITKNSRFNWIIMKTPSRRSSRVSEGERERRAISAFLDVIICTLHCTNLINNFFHLWRSFLAVLCMLWRRRRLLPLLYWVPTYKYICIPY